MSDKRLQPISAFEWASVTQYIVYISGVAELLEINSSHVERLPLATLGPAKLLSRKLKMSVVLKSNLRRLERFAERFKDELDKNELSVVRGMYRQYKNNLETVQRHLEVIEDYARAVDKSMFEQSEAEDNAPF